MITATTGTTKPTGTTEPTTVQEPQVQAGGGTGTPKCDGCPRCQDAQAGFCPTYHHEFGGRHPVCKVCHHCVLRGKHQDDASDLDNYRGMSMPGMDTVHRN